MGFLFLLFCFIEAFPFGPVDNGRKGYFLVVFLLQSILDIAIVVVGKGNILILNQSLFDPELSDNVLLYLSAYASSWPFSLVFDGKVLRIFPVDFEKLEEPPLGNLKYLQDIL